MADSRRAPARVTGLARFATLARRRNLAQAARRVALAKGLRRGGGWTVVAVVLWAPRVSRALFGRRSEVVTTTRVRPGEVVEVRTTRPPTRRERRAG